MADQSTRPTRRSRRSSSRTTSPVVVDFWATWCGPCKMVAPEMEKIAAKYEGAVDVVKVDVDANPGLSQAFNIMSIPTIAFFKPGPAAEGRGRLPADGAARAAVRSGRVRQGAGRRAAGCRAAGLATEPPTRPIRQPETPVHPGLRLPAVASSGRPVAQRDRSAAAPAEALSNQATARSTAWPSSVGRAKRDPAPARASDADVSGVRRAAARDGLGRGGTRRASPSASSDREQPLATFVPDRSVGPPSVGSTGDATPAAASRRTSASDVTGRQLRPADAEDRGQVVRVRPRSGRSSRRGRTRCVVGVLEPARLGHDGQVAAQLAGHGPEPLPDLVHREGPPACPISSLIASPRASQSASAATFAGSTRRSPAPWRRSRRAPARRRDGPSGRDPTSRGPPRGSASAGRR